jgi:hypothetical protein
MYGLGANIFSSSELISASLNILNVLWAIDAF